MASDFTKRSTPSTCRHVKNLNIWYVHVNTSEACFLALAAGKPQGVAIRTKICSIILHVTFNDIHHSDYYNTEPNMITVMRQ